MIFLPKIENIGKKFVSKLYLNSFTDYITINMETAHPHTDKNGNYLNMGTTFGKNTFYNVVKCDPKKVKLKKIWILQK